MGSFLSHDNYVQAPTNSQSYNRYSYCLNNPLRYTDPSGWQTKEEEEEKKARDEIALRYAEWYGRDIFGREMYDNMGMYIPASERSGGAGVANYGDPRYGHWEAVTKTYSCYSYYEDKDGNRHYSQAKDVDSRTRYEYVYDEAAGQGSAGHTDLTGLGLAITGTGLSAGQVKMFNKETWFSIKQWKTYGQNFNGNGYTGGKIASAKTISNAFKWAGRGLGAYCAYSTNQQYQNGEIDAYRMTLDQTSNAYSTFGGIYGAAWGVGWETGRTITQMNWYQQWKQEVWYTWREEHLGY